MKIGSAPFASASRPAERPQLLKAVNGNAELAAAAERRPGVVSTYPLPANLEPHRKMFDKAGFRISKLPTAELQQAAIERTADWFKRKLGNQATLEQINTALNRSVEYFSRRSTTTNDPQCLRAVHSVEEAARDPKSTGLAQRPGRPQPWEFQDVFEVLPTYQPVQLS